MLPRLARSAGVGRPPSPEKPAAVLKAATEAFARDGFDAASVDAIAQQAAVSKRTLYKYFQRKEKLFEALVG
ncbi:helix-turn-helix domain-containing protein, partial [Klebsiella pneumoniae]